MHKILIILFVLLLQSSIVAATEIIPDEMAEDIKVLMQLTKVSQVPKTIADAYIHVVTVQLMESGQSLTKENIQALEDEINNYFNEDSKVTNYFYAEAYKIYSNIYTHSEIKELIEFYSSDLGKKVTENSSRLNMQVHAIRNQWFSKYPEDIKDRIQERLKKEGLKWN